MQKKSQFTTVRMSLSVKNQAKEIAARKQRSLQAFIEDAVTAYIKRYKK